MGPNWNPPELLEGAVLRRFGSWSLFPQAAGTTVALLIPKVEIGALYVRRPWHIIAICLLAAFCCTRPAALLAQLIDDQDLDSASFAASSAVPLDSWVYPAIDRLTALGYAPSAMQGMRPWTRLQCARLVEEAQGVLDAEADAVDPDALQIVERLRLEFLYEIALLHGSPNRSVGLTDSYERITEIAGPPLRDSFHFGQTIYDDFGRPYGQGYNSISGAQFHGEYGPFSAVLRGDFQQSRSLFPYNANALNAIAVMDDLPVQPLPGVSALDRMRPVEATISLKLYGWQATFGEQSQWWGHARSTSLILSNNAEAPVVLLIQHDKPVQLPWVFAYLGKMNNTFFMGQLRGHHYVRGPYPTFALYGSATQTLNPQPFIWGDQLDLKMTPNLELGFEITCMWAGYGRPATLGTWLHTFNFRGNFQSIDPGKRFGGFHIAYRLPRLRDVTLYNDELANDEPTPLNYPQDSAMNPGFYIARLPRLDRVDLRMEGMYTNIPDYADGIGQVYFNEHYASGYRNAGQIMGSWVGRGGVAYYAKSTYWFSGTKRIDVSWRHQYNDRHMIGGGDLTDFSAHTFWQLGESWQAEGGFTTERWRFPILRPTAANNVTASFGLIFTPPMKATRP